MNTHSHSSIASARRERNGEGERGERGRFAGIIQSERMREVGEERERERERERSG
jgi:hypothetical protein